jgi:hypothetical protein
MPTDEAAPAPVAESELVLRPADEDDADALALIHLLARRAAPMPDRPAPTTRTSTCSGWVWLMG